MVKNLTTKEFKDLIFDFDKESKWKFKGDKPVITDFFANWCGPCKAVEPILEELSKEYNGKIDIYRVDVDQAHELSKEFKIRSIPSILFIPLNEEPQMMVGALPKTSFEKTIKEVLKIE